MSAPYSVKKEGKPFRIPFRVYCPKCGKTLLDKWEVDRQKYFSTEHNERELERILNR
jgi:hypothetical protein